MFDTQINVLINDVWTYEWMNVIQILHLPISMRVKCVFNAWYQCMKCTNYKWMNFAWFLLLTHEMLNLWWIQIVMLNKSLGGGGTWKKTIDHKKI